MPKRLITITAYDGGSESDANVKEFMEKIIKNVPSEYLETATINIDGYDGVDVSISYTREETDEECVSRLAQEKEMRERNKKHELKQLEDLIKKYGIPNEIK